MIQGYKNISIIYGGTGREYAQTLKNKIEDISNAERFPICARVINDRVLTRELLHDVMKQFKECDFCVAFFTKDDSCLVENTKKTRLRQNVIFELGMALIELGRERCIFLSDFDINDPDFELPSDMNSLEILNFKKSDINAVLDDVIDKILHLSRQSIISGNKTDKIPRYDHLLTRTEYRIDYENIFLERPITLASEGQAFFNDTLTYWKDECESLPHFDEKCIFLLERLGFLPAFGKNQEVNNFLEQAEVLIEKYSENDINYYGDTSLLDFTLKLVRCVIEYIKIKNEDMRLERRIDYTKINDEDMNAARRIVKYRELLQRFLCNNIEAHTAINPLIKVIHYDYLGLAYLCVYRAEKHEEDLNHAREVFQKSLDYVKFIDMSMQIWSGYLTYNIARVLSECNVLGEAERYFKESIQIRRNWLRISSYNITVRNALSYEYFIAKISYLDMCQQYHLMSRDEIKNEYSLVENELDNYSNADSTLGSLDYIRQLLKDRKNNR